MFKKLFNELEKDVNYVIEVSLNKDKLKERLCKLIDEEKVLPALLYFCKE